MSIFETIKAAISVPQAAAYYGMKIQLNNMTRCCFHDDHHPSLKLNDTYFYCFACLEHGDVIDLVASCTARAIMLLCSASPATSASTRTARLRQQQSPVCPAATPMKISADLSSPIMSSC